MNILICDDESSVLESMCQLPATRKHQIRTVMNGEEALEELKKNDIDLLFLDVLMPGEDGFDVLRQAKKIQPGIIVVMMTGFIVKEKEAQELGVFDYLYKPFDFSKVNWIIDRVAEKRIDQKNVMHN